MPKADPLGGDSPCIQIKVLALINLAAMIWIRHLSLHVCRINNYSFSSEKESEGWEDGEVSRVLVLQACRFDVSSQHRATS